MLRFTFASTRRLRLPSRVADSLGADWEIEQAPFGSVAESVDQSDFIWVDLDGSREADAVGSVLKRLVGSLDHTQEARYLFISANSGRRGEMKHLLELFAATEHPELIEMDLMGRPDVVSAVAKFKALRASWRPETHSWSGRLTPTGGTLSQVVSTGLLLETPGADLRTERGNLAADLLANLYGVSLTELGGWIGKKKAALSKTPDAPALQQLLAPLEEIARMRQLLGGDAAFRKWLRTSSRMLKGHSPLHWIESGHLQDVADFVDDASSGQPT